MDSIKTDNTRFKSLLKKLTFFPTAFDVQDVEEVFNLLISRKVTDAQTGAFLTAFKLNKVDAKPEIIRACVSTIRKHSLKIAFKDDSPEFRDSLVDIVGTGGDGHDTFNVSTASALIASSTGARVLKHGNRSSSSKSGSSDFLASLSFDLDKLSPANVPRILEKCNFCFLFASTFHPSWKAISTVRKELGFPTVFNYLGPLCNPAQPGRMVVGVYSKELGPIVAETLLLLGVTRGLVVHGDEGLDEISPEKDTHSWLISEGKVTYSVITPEDFGLSRNSLETVKGGSSEENADLFRRIVSGEVEEGPILDFILLNTSAVLFVSGVANDFKQGVALARSAIFSGKAKKHLDNTLGVIQNL